MVAVEMALIILIQVAMSRKCMGFWTWMLREVWVEAGTCTEWAGLSDTPVWAQSSWSQGRKGPP